MRAQEELFKLIIKNTCEIAPELEGHQFSQSDSLKNLGINSMDRSEVIMMTLEDLSLNIPLVDFHSAKNIGELATLFHDKQ